MSFFFRDVSRKSSAKKLEKNYRRVSGFCPKTCKKWKKAKKHSTGSYCNTCVTIGGLTHSTAIFIFQKSGFKTVHISRGQIKYPKAGRRNFLLIRGTAIFFFNKKRRFFFSDREKKKHEVQ